jgi:hypothetical protein
MPLDLCKLLGMVFVLGLTVSLQAAPAQPAEGKAAVKCRKRPTGGTPLFFKLKRPVAEHGAAARAILRERFPCLRFWCTRKGEMFAHLSEREARKLLGRHVAYETVKGAGNNVDTDATFVSIRPASFVPELLKDHVTRLAFNDDPKFLYTGPSATKCE